MRRISSTFLPFHKTVNYVFKHLAFTPAFAQTEDGVIINTYLVNVTGSKETYSLALNELRLSLASSTTNKVLNLLENIMIKPSVQLGGSDMTTLRRGKSFLAFEMLYEWNRYMTAYLFSVDYQTPEGAVNLSAIDATTQLDDFATFVSEYSFIVGSLRKYGNFIGCNVNMDYEQTPFFASYNDVFESTRNHKSWIYAYYYQKVLSDVPIQYWTLTTKKLTKTSGVKEVISFQVTGPSATIMDDTDMVIAYNDSANLGTIEAQITGALTLTEAEITGEMMQIPTGLTPTKLFIDEVTDNDVYFSSAISNDQANLLYCLGSAFYLVNNVIKVVYPSGFLKPYHTLIPTPNDESSFQTKVLDHGVFSCISQNKALIKEVMLTALPVINSVQDELNVTENGIRKERRYGRELLIGILRNGVSGIESS